MFEASFANLLTFVAIAWLLTGCIRVPIRVSAPYGCVYGQRLGPIVDVRTACRDNEPRIGDFSEQDVHSMIGDADRSYAVRCSFFEARKSCTREEFDFRGTAVYLDILSGQHNSNVQRTIDETIGSVTALNLTISAPDSEHFTFLQSQGSNSGIYQISAGIAASGRPAFFFALPTASLVGYSGSTIASDAAPANFTVSDLQFTGTSLDILASGSLTVAPLPSSAWGGLVLIGGLGLTTFLRPSCASINA